MLHLAEGLDAKQLATAYRTHGRLQIRDFLAEPGAAALHRELADSQHWRLTVNRGEVIYDFHPDEVAAWPARKAELLDQAVVMGGRSGFQFRYEVIRIGKAPSPLLAAFADFMSSPGVVRFMRVLTGEQGIDFADAHASRYRPGHFLTTHDDRAELMGRRAAYVLNLTPNWRPDWGGLLQFFDAEGNVSRAFAPGFNVLTIFRVPQPHSVGWVNPLAAEPRYAITGWLRAAGAPGASAT
jgi:Rps23 Pro-64 3,4-dihydroxylase Tpa1-like proline 4-hydroxylase